MKKYIAPAMKVMAVNMNECLLATSDEYQIGSDDLGLQLFSPDGGNPNDAI